MDIVHFQMENFYRTVDFDALDANFRPLLLSTGLSGKR